MTFSRRGVAALALTCLLLLLPVGFSLASGPDKPDAQTQDPTQITSTAARLNGKVKPRGLVSTWWFEYGTTKSYGQTTPVGVGLLGDDWASVVANVSGLQPDTTYHYRVVASNALGIKQAGDKTFKTAKANGAPADDSGSGSSCSGSGDDSSGSGSSGDDSSGSTVSASGGDDDKAGDGKSGGSGSSGDDSEPELG